MANIEIVKPITLTFKDGKTYTLEFNRNSVMSAERAGLVLQDVLTMSKPATVIPTLFFAAFKMHHPEVTRDQAEKMLADMGGLPQEAVQRLIELYVTPVNTLIRNEDDGEAKNVTISL